MERRTQIEKTRAVSGKKRYRRGLCANGVVAQLSLTLDILSTFLCPLILVVSSSAVAFLVAVAASHKDGVSEFVGFNESPAPSPGVVVVFAEFPFRFPRRSLLSADKLGDDVGYVLPCKIV